MNLNFRYYRNFRYLKQWHVLMSILVGTLLSQGCSSQLKLDSRWSPEQINIDGDESDWQGALTYVDGKNVSIGIKNDGEFLYICLVSTDGMLQRQMMMRGFTAWFDPIVYFAKMTSADSTKSAAIQSADELIRPDSQNPSCSVPGRDR